MKSTHYASTPNPGHISFEIFCSQIRNIDIKLIQNVLATTYRNMLDVILGGELESPQDAFNSKRNQYNADILLSYLLKTKKADTALWIIKKDLYCKDMNFIFGYATFYRGAVLSVCRLSTSELIEKEAIHEVGHVLGLKHCSNNCVMQFSNSLSEVKTKPLNLCKSCLRKINLI